MNSTRIFVPIHKPTQSLNRSPQSTQLVIRLISPKLWRLIPLVEHYHPIMAFGELFQVVKTYFSVRRVNHLYKKHGPKLLAQKARKVMFLLTNRDNTDLDKQEQVVEAMNDLNKTFKMLTGVDAALYGGGGTPMFRQAWNEFNPEGTEEQWQQFMTQIPSISTPNQALDQQVAPISVASDDSLLNSLSSQVTSTKSSQEEDDMIKNLRDMLAKQKEEGDRLLQIKKQMQLNEQTTQ